MSYRGPLLELSQRAVPSAAVPHLADVACFLIHTPGDLVDCMVQGPNGLLGGQRLTEGAQQGRALASNERRGVLQRARVTGKSSGRCDTAFFTG